ncbi:hypothetical protein ACGF1Z_17910 [Streptomyces sp. NPDC048018]|uniref:hypothetical protein n=1 Tax=Streptomyces sp. NPDC048018 TaxID=3365499 RepID=UPI00372369FE
MRPRIHRTTWPRPALVLTDTPRPDCPNCEGDGWCGRDYGDYETSEDAWTGWECDPCPCWDENRRWVLLPLPRRHPNGYSAEPPF